MVEFVGKPKSYNSSEGVDRFFCDICGSSIAYQNRRWPDDIHLFIGTFDDPEKITPEFHIFTRERLSWFNRLDDIPAHATTPPAGDRK